MYHFASSPKILALRSIGAKRSYFAWITLPMNEEFWGLFFITKIHFIIFLQNWQFRGSLFSRPLTLSTIIRNYRLPETEYSKLKVEIKLFFYTVYEVFFYEPSRDKVQGEIYVSVDLYRLVIFILSTAFTFEAETYVLQSDSVPKSWPISCRYPFLHQSDHR